MESAAKVPWIETPLIRSGPLSKIAKCNIFLKLENLQPSGSFKSRGVGNFLLASLRQCGGSRPHFYISSGGNAGLGCVHAAVTLECRATLVVPNSTTEFMIELLRAAGAFDVVQEGESWAEADKHLREVMMPGAASSRSGEAPVYVPPFDAQDIWDGNATMVPEILRQLQQANHHYPMTISEDKAIREVAVLPDAIICSVGGGGLFNGICQGIDQASLASFTKIIAVETEGADSLSQAISKKELVTLPGITSIATSLGARTVSAKSLEYGLREDMVLPYVAPDAMAVSGCRKLAEYHKLLVEPACGVCLAPIIQDRLHSLLPNIQPESNVIIVVCGGSNVSLEILAKYAST